VKEPRGRLVYQPEGTDRPLKGLREPLSTAIQAIFVRPAASRARNLLTEDRVKIVWMDDEPVDVPHRGERFEPKPYTWKTS
jgi:hypothetical protein